MIWGALCTTIISLAIAGATLGLILGGTGLVLLHFLVGEGAGVMAAEVLWTDLTKYTLASILMFILVGDLFFESGMASESYRALSPLFQRIPGKLLHTNVAVCMLFGAVSGTSTATAAAVGSSAYPELISRRYNRYAVLGSLAGAGTLGLLIPPSIALILYGALMDVSIAKLFLGGIFPGILFGLAFMAYIAILSLTKEGITPKQEAQHSSAEIMRSLLNIWPLLILMTSILGPLYFGLATPTESASFGAMFLLVLGFTVGELTVCRLISVLQATMIKFGAIVFVVMGAIILKQAVGILGLPRMAVDTITSISPDATYVLIAIIVFYLAVGCLFDGISILLLTSPFVAPLLISCGYDPIWIGVLITILIEIGMITPPVGPNLFVLSSIACSKVSVGEIAIATIPYWLILLAGIAMITWFPQIVLWLPNQIM
ncbi:TRAP transporter large permease [Grimontia sp. SpTr1]|uniref:TRAP transporter large permease n=1 Tax=Grimontia sp. SpTr1 TaxID=2995319 RepID=UPI00248CB2CB|nr:TRAP transporter large permease [Grimontia sp. SpTr1]